MSETVGSIQVVASINTKDYDAGKKQIEKGNSELEGGANKTSKGFSAAWTGAIAGVALALTNKFVGAVTSSISTAVKRVDTLNNAERTFKNMGIGAVDSAKSMDALEKSIKGLPTPLDSAVRGMTNLTATYGDIDKGQQVFSALNNAILGFGGSSAMVDNAITQLSQLPMDGPLDAQTWNSLRNSGITPVLTAMAKDSGMSVSAMKEAFGSGELSVQDFTDRLLKMNTEGGGGLTSLEQIAKDSTNGIGTGFANMQTAIARGVAGIIEAVGSDNISSGITAIGDAFSDVLGGVKSVINFVKKNSGVFSALAVGIGAAGTAIVLYSGYTKAAAVFTAAYAAVSSYLTLVMSLQAQGLGVARAAWMALNIVMRANPIGILITLLVALVAAVVWFFTQTETGKAIISSVFGFIKGVFTGLVNFIKKWGLTILAVMFLPFALVLGLIFMFKDEIAAIFKAIWKGIKTIFGPVASFFKGVFTGAWNAIKNVFGKLYGFFKGVWDKVVGLFKNVGSKVGSAIGGTFKSAINGVLRFAVGIINGFINSINGVIGIINKIPKVNVPKVGRLPVPQLADGGITTGPTLAMIGEGSEQEAVLPLSKLEALINSDGKDKNKEVNVGTIIINKDVDIDTVARKLGIKQLDSRRGIV